MLERVGLVRDSMSDELNAGKNNIITIRIF